MSVAHINFGERQWSSSTSHPGTRQKLFELELIYETAPIGIFLCDRDYRFIRVNRHLAEINGIPVEQHAGKLVWDIVPALQPILEPVFRRVLDGESFFKLDVAGLISKTSGTHRYWEASYCPIYGEDDEVIAISGIVDEVTDRRAKEAEQRNSQARLQRLLEANLFGVATETVEGPSEVNDALLAIIGYSREDFVQHRINWAKITPPEHAEKDLEKRKILADTGICPAFEKEYIRKDGRRVPVLVGATLLDRQPLCWMKFVIDLSEQAAREEHTRSLMQELRHRSKNLIAVIAAIARLLAKTSDNLKDFEARFGARLQALADVQDSLVTDGLRGCNVSELAVSQLAHCRELLDHRVFLAGEPVSLSASACQYLGMAFHELCTNALKYGALSNDTGTVTIRWTLKPADHAEILTIEWIESGGPSVIEPAHQGFGDQVTTEIIARALDAGVSRAFRKEGLRWRLVLPARHLVIKTPAQDPQGAPAESAEPVLEARATRTPEIGAQN